MRRVLVAGGPVVATACQPFTSDLVASNRAWFRYGWVWEKTTATGFLDANRRPLRAHEDVLVFCPRRPPYQPQFGPGRPYDVSRPARPGGVATIRDKKASGCAGRTRNAGRRYPRSVIRFANEWGRHPTQKPVELMRYLVRTYTRPGELILDPFGGSGTTAVAALLEGRRCLLVERDPAYAAAARRRVREALKGAVA